MTEHEFPDEILSVFGEAWFICSCGERVDIPVDGSVVRGEAIRNAFREHVEASLDSADVALEAARSRLLEGAMTDSPCWCDEPCRRDPCPSRDHWLEVDDSEVPGEWDEAISRDMAARWDQ